MSAASVTLVIVSWNTRDLLARCLESMAADVRDGQAAVCVVDNASSDGSAEMVERDFPWATVVRSGGNIGFGPAVNLGVRAMPATPWVAPANADIALEPGTLRTLLEAPAPRSGALAPLLVGADGEPQHSVYPFPGLGFTLLFNLGLHRVSRRWADRHCVPGAWNRMRRRPVPWVVGAFLLVRREAWEQVGGFDESQWMYAEDLDLGWRLAQAGWTTLYVPEARVLHYGAAAAEQAWGDDARLDRWTDATYAWMLRRRGLVRTRLVAALNVGGSLVRIKALHWLVKRDPDRWHSGLEDNVRWNRVHKLGLRPRAQIGALSAPPER
jgi:N-acetylglucosaminyl-diphospho-decaprenol L-rhamnosyltransferase